MAIKATATNAKWFTEGANSARALSNPELSKGLRQQIEQSVRIYGKRTDRQALSWIEGFNSVSNAIIDNSAFKVGDCVRTKAFPAYAGKVVSLTVKGLLVSYGVQFDTVKGVVMADAYEHEIELAHTVRND